MDIHDNIGQFIALIIGLALMSRPVMCSSGTKTIISHVLVLHFIINNYSTMYQGTV